MIPIAIKKLLHSGLVAMQRNRYRKKLYKTPLDVSSADIVLNYGGVLSGKSKSFLCGGLVKLVHLEKEFPENKNSFNILYLVSSAPPPFAIELIRWAKGHGVKFVLNQNGVAYPAWAGDDYKRANQPLADILKLADYVVYQSRFCKESADRYLGAISVPNSIIHNYVETDSFTPYRGAGQKKPWTLLMAGSHLQPERVMSALRTLACLKEKKRNTHLILAGQFLWEGAVTQIDKIVQQLGIRAELTIVPPYTQAEAPDIYRKAHVLIHPKYKDPCPTVPIEAMSCGLPVIGSKSGGMAELVGDDAGILLDVPESWDRMHYPDEQELAGAVERIMENIDKWSIAARKRALKMFGKERWIARHRDIFKSLLDE